MRVWCRLERGERRYCIFFVLAARKIGRRRARRAALRVEACSFGAPRRALIACIQLKEGVAAADGELTKRGIGRGEIAQKTILSRPPRPSSRLGCDVGVRYVIYIRN